MNMGSEALKNRLSMQDKRAVRLLSSAEIQERCLELLIVFDGVCRDLDLRYSLSGGTLLGAIRHRGFIPWDDDVDVNMLRADFDFFRTVADEVFSGTGYYVSGSPHDDCNPCYIKLLTKHVAVNDRYSEGVSNLWLDIFPVDGMPDNDRGTARLCRRAMLYRKVAWLGKADADEGKTRVRRLLKRLIQPAVRSFGLDRRYALKLSNLSRGIPCGETPRIGVIVAGYGAGERVPADAFDKLVDVEFEGRYFKSMYCWDEYLTGLYGDYMQLPPEGERKTHEMRAWLTDVEGE